MQVNGFDLVKGWHLSRAEHTLRQNIKKFLESTGYKRTGQNNRRNAVNAEKISKEIEDGNERAKEKDMESGKSDLILHITLCSIWR